MTKRAIILSLFIIFRAAIPPAEAETVKVLSANIGNSDLLCVRHAWKLCLDSVEKRVGRSIQEIDADIVFLQEVVPAGRCQRTKDPIPGFVCHDFENREEKQQARRILGPGYSIVQTQDPAAEAIAVKVGAGLIEGCPEGGFCEATMVVAMPEGCDPGFSITAVDAVIKGTKIRLINGHPDSISVSCRAAGLEGLWEFFAPGRTLMAGDWNLDPYRGADRSVDIWKQGIEEHGLKYHSGAQEHDPPYHTIFIPLVEIPLRSLDHVLSDFAEGTCQTMGPAPDTERLDGGFDNDHRALVCELELEN